MTFTYSAAHLIQTSVDLPSFFFFFGQRTLTMFVEVMALRCGMLITKCHNFHKHSQSPLVSSTNYEYKIKLCACKDIK